MLTITIAIDCLTNFFCRKHDDITVFFYDSAVKQERSTMSF